MLKKLFCYHLDLSIIKTSFKERFKRNGIKIVTKVIEYECNECGKKIIKKENYGGRTKR